MKRGEFGVEYRVAERGRDYVVVELRGELSRSGRAEWLRDALEEHFIDDGVRDIELDLSELTFLDALGVSTLVTLMKEAQRRGKRLRVERVHDQVLGKLREMGVASILGAEPRAR
jgi:anti-anti-sigma factor